MDPQFAKGFAAGMVVGSARRQRPAQTEDVVDGIGTWIFLGIVMTLMDAFWLYCVWPLWPLVLAGVLSFVFVMALSVAGIREARERHR